MLQAGEARISIGVPSKSRGATGEGKSALARSVADNLTALPQQQSRGDESFVSMVAAIFDPDDQPPEVFHAELEQAIREHASAWTLAAPSASGCWRVQRAGGDPIEVRAVHWRAPGNVLDGLADQVNLERLLCAVLEKAYPSDVERVAQLLTEIGRARQAMDRKPPTWKAAIHVWLAMVYEKADELNAASRVLHQQDECKPHVESVLIEVGLLEDLRPLLA
ncbi:MAG: hypothetical protein ABI193_06245 [Minicystis sp.]